MLLALSLLVASGSAHGQEPERRLTAEDYAAAERMLADHTEPLVYRADVVPVWLADGRFWYAVSVPGGREHLLIDPRVPSRAPAFDHARLAAALSSATGERVGPLDLRVIALDPERALAMLATGDARHVCRRAEYTCAPAPEGREARRDEVVSPDGSRAAFIRDHDLWVRDLESGDERRVTWDGEEDYGYATNNAGWVRSDRPVLKWSPDSRRIATFQHDGRGVGMMYTTTTNVGHPELDAWRYPLAGDSLIFRISRVVIDLERPPGQEVVRLDMPPDPHRSTCSDHVTCGGTFGDVHWSADGDRLVFVSSSRDHKRAQMRVADAATGAVRDLFEEVEETFFDSGHDAGGNWRFLSASNQVLWYSQRDDWSHLYLYDVDTGRLEGRVTEGAWNVRAVERVDEEAREVWLMGSEREGGDPYFPYLYRVGLDGGGVSLLTPDSAHHAVSISPDGDFVVDRYSTPIDAPVTVLRDRDGRLLMTLEQADVSALRAAGWQPPMSFTVKARDGETDLWGLLFRPSDFDPSRRYPVVNYVYPGPMGSSVGSRAFRAAHRDLQAIAELGFVVVALDAMGTPGRNKPFHEAYYGNMGDNGLPDQIGGIRQLAERHPWIDTGRVGIYGHSGGGYAAADAILRHPDFYDVAVSQAGNHDNRNYEDDWAEKWQGLLEVYPDGSTNYDNQANQLLAENLVGKLLIAHGTLDTNVPVSNTMLLVDALIEANKDFDLLVLPNRGHGFGNEAYMTRRRWDYFVRHLLDAEPPREYEMGRLARPVS
jgi:dipeptidyl aminopeptidase/acylaminoacyl peptidase